MSACPSCGHENAVGAKFCSECGAALIASAPAARAERKIVTVLFADLVGFTARAERLDPEDVRAVLAPYHARLRSELERYGGTVEKFIGDAVMALFGAPIAHEDDPERALRAALAIRDWVAEEGKLQVRIGVNTGEALIDLAARPESGEGMAAGDVVNTAARIQTAAPVNGILVGEATYRSTSQTIDYREPATIEAKGKEEPIAVWEVVQARSRFGVDLAQQGAAALVGRERELELLKSALTRARLQESPELVTLVGVPGIGKSRLVGELMASIERGEQDSQLIFWRQGRSLPYGEGVSFWALAEMVKAQAGILETDDVDEADAKLARAVDSLVQEDAEWMKTHLRPLIGQASSELPGGSRDEAFAAWRRFFEAMAEQRPLVLVFEDVQWADDGLLDFVEYLVDWVRGVPLFILCTGRLELLERRPAWGGGKVNAATVALAPLSDHETAKLISSLSERPVLPAEMQAALLTRAGGNPLYAEQYVRMLAERDGAEDLPLPESVQGIIAARLDALSHEEKALLQDAAVIGKVFWLGALDATEQQLHALQQKEFVQRARRSSVEGETEFAFQHLLVRDVAYGQIPRGDRADKHCRAAEWIESLGRPEDHAETVAHHYLSALELMRAAGHDVGAVASRARTALREAGDRATALNALGQAERYYTEALDLVGEDDSERPQLLFRLGKVRYLSHEEGEADLDAARMGLIAAGDRETAAEAAVMLADLCWRVGRHEELYAYIDEARSLAEASSPSRVQVTVLSHLSRYAMLSDRSAQAIEYGRESLGLAGQLGLDDLRAHALNNIGTARVAQGDGGGVGDLEESIALATRVNSIPDLLRGHNNLATSHVMLGHMKQASEIFDETMRLSEHFGFHGFGRFVKGGAAVANAYMMGDWDDALERTEAFLADLEPGSPHYHAAFGHITRSMIRLGRGDLEEAEKDAELAIDYARPIRDGQIVQTTFAKAAFVLLSVGRNARVNDILSECFEGLKKLERLGFAAVEMHHVAWAARALGREAEVLEILERENVESPWVLTARAVSVGDLLQAADLLQGMSCVTDESFYRMHAAAQLIGEGRRAEADEQLGRALGFFRSVGATWYLGEGEALLAASA